MSARKKADKLYNTVMKAVAETDRVSFMTNEVDRWSHAANQLKTTDKRKIHWKELQERKPNKRTGMGHYIFDANKGEQPLTPRDLPTPGPADYDPNYCKTSLIKKGPEFSIRSTTCEVGSTKKIPGPKYNTSRGFLQCKSQQVTVKGRNIPATAKEGIVGPGPGAYLVTNKTIASQSMRAKNAKPSNKIKTAFSSTLALSTNKSGVTDNAELVNVDQTSKSYRLGDAPKWTMAGRHESTSEPLPGPAEYDRPAECCRNPPPGKTMLGRRPFRQEVKDDIVPAPNNYSVPLNDKPQPPRAVVIPRRNQNSGTDAPAPNEYAIRGAYDKQRRNYDWRGPNITFRGNYAGEVQQEKLPGPSDYRPYRDERVPGGTMCVGKESVPYPDCLHYNAQLKSTQTTSGAGMYYPTNHCIANNSGPSYSFKGVAGTKEQKVAAGAGDYNIRGMTRKGFSSAPKYSFPSYSPHQNVTGETIPAPWDYDIGETDPGKGYSMAGRNTKPNQHTRKPKRGAKAPGPKYNVSGVTRTGPLSCGEKGVGLKYRHSPHVYAGTSQRSKLLPNSSGDRTIQLG